MIKHDPGFGTIFTGSDVNVFRWLSVRSQLRLEQRGMMSSGGAIRPRIAAELGLKPRDPYDKFYAAIAAILGEKPHGR